MAPIPSGTLAQMRNKTASLSIIVTRKNQYQNDGQPNSYGGNAIWNGYVFNFLRKIPIVSDVFKVIGSSFQTLGAATEKARLPKLSFVLGTISCEIDDISCLGILEICRRLAK